MNDDNRNSGAAKSLKDKAEQLGLTGDQLVKMYTDMCRIRRFEQMADRMYAAGKVHGTMHLSAGQEAVAVGAGNAMRPDDYLLNHHRGHGHFIAKGADIDRMMAEFLGKETGYCKGRGGSMHIADVEANNLGANGIVGGGISLAVGAGLAVKMRHDPQIVLCIFGDGAANQGIFHESLNMAALWDLPVVFLCENNQYGMSMPVERATSKTPIADRAGIYGMPGHRVDGNDVLAVFEVMSQAAGHARQGNGPVLVEAITYRYFGHSKSDRNLYRTKEEIEEWKKSDPIVRFKKVLVDAGVLSSDNADELDQKAQSEIDGAVAYAEASPDPDPTQVTEYVYA
ncbi:MAG: pyruvate dehydrogenase (acetyl-transferring) E1 component subunit alpha [Candidatus Promineifilaceae bacterium]